MNPIYQPGQRVNATGYGKTQLGVVTSVHPYPTVDDGVIVYEVMTVLAGILPYYETDLTTAATNPQPGQWWTHNATGHKVLVEDCGDGLVTKCRTVSGNPTLMLIDDGWTLDQAVA